MSTNLIFGAAAVLLVIAVCIAIGLWVRAVGCLMLASVALFCGYGFLASFEPGPGHLYFRVGYAVVGVIAALAGCYLAFAAPDNSKP